jgi:hypothetical protein
MRKLYSLFTLAAAMLVATTLGAGTAAAQASDIKVHGHWTIDVRNVDGTLASHNEFENELTPGTAGGSLTLARLLTRSDNVLFWRIGLSGGQTGPCGTLFSCDIMEPGDPIPASDHGFKNLEVSAVSGPQGGPPNMVQLAGHFTASFASDINRVASEIVLTPSLVVSPFSLRVLAQAIQVAAGQEVYVKVVLSFS